MAVTLLLKGWIIGLLFLVMGSASCFAVELPPTTSEQELVRSLSLHEDKIIVNGNTYVIEDGVIYRLIQGKRFRPRCRDREMEQLLPRVTLTQVFDKDSVEVGRKYRSLLDRLGHAVKWGVLSKHSFSIVAYADQSAPKRNDPPLMQQRAGWIKDYLERRWGVPSWRLSISESCTAGLSEAPRTPKAPGPNSDEGVLEIISIGTSGSGLFEACEDWENGV